MAVERSRWTDERLDDLAERVVSHDALTEKVDDLRTSVDGIRTEISAVRTEMSAVRTEMSAMRTELGTQITDLRRELYSTRWTVVGIWLGLAAIFVEIALRS
jgi:predicted  nucleic acid-binding Zn-ribbon protein